MPNAPLHFPTSLPLPAFLGAIFGLAPMQSVAAATLLVSNCGDGADSGTLRNTIAGAPDGSTVQIPLACSTITLTNGEIIVKPIADMTIVGQGPSATRIDANANARAFASGHTGTLKFKDLTIAHASHAGAVFPAGGCIYGLGNIYLENTAVTDCQLAPTTGSATAKGGGIFSYGSVTLAQSSVTASVVSGAPGRSSVGGGIYASQGILAVYSTVSGNAAYSGAASSSLSTGGGIYCPAQSVLINNSTISGNKADVDSALHVSGDPASSALILISSTISGNIARQAQTVGSNVPVFVTNSTIAFNRAGNTLSVEPVGLFSSQQISMNNSIFANNTSQGTTNDVFSEAPFDPLIGSDNLITGTSQAVPLGTVSTCPRLGHLSNNGGPTPTIPLLANSPALDVGAANGQSTDQRGTGFPRTAGSGTDIGAYERQPGTIDDVIFFGEFESRCD